MSDYNTYAVTKTLGGFCLQHKTKRKPKKQTTSSEMTRRASFFTRPRSPTDSSSRGLVLTARGREGVHNEGDDDRVDTVRHADDNCASAFPLSHSLPHTFPGPRERVRSLSERWTAPAEGPPHAICMDTAVPSAVRWGLPAFAAFSSALFLMGQLLPSESVRVRVMARATFVVLARLALQIQTHLTLTPQRAARAKQCGKSARR